MVDGSGSDVNGVNAGAYDLCSGVCARAVRLAAEFMLDIQEGQKKS